MPAKKKTIAKKVVTKASQPIKAAPKSTPVAPVKPKEPRVTPFVASVGPNGTLNY